LLNIAVTLIYYYFANHPLSMKYKFTLLLVLLALSLVTKAQFLMDMLDTTKEAGKGLVGIYKKFDHLRIGGYIQPQYQAASQNGVKTFEGTDFGANVNNRFMLRRSRVRIDYLHSTGKGSVGVQVVFQFDANERGFTLRDVWGRVFENKYQLFSFTTGMFARPFGFETNLSSSDRESPERGRMNQILMKSERDLGAMVSVDARKKDHPLQFLKVDLGLFNGQGINASGDFDNKKDLIARVALKPKHLGKQWILSAGTSLLSGGLVNNTKYVYSTEMVGGTKKVVVDSSVSNIGRFSPRRYYGADLQLKYQNKVGFTEIRGEFITGTQTGTNSNSETPNALLTGTDGFQQRHFNGAYFYFLQHLGSLKRQLVVKYDWYDPNTDVKGNDIGAAGSNFTATNIQYSTWHFGYVHHLSDNVKLLAFYSLVKNEKTLLTGYTGDVNDNVFTCRLQFRF
jgi:hypothetical protein